MSGVQKIQAVSDSKGEEHYYVNHVQKPGLIGGKYRRNIDNAVSNYAWDKAATFEENHCQDKPHSYGNDDPSK